MLNGKELRHCTFAEVSTFGQRYAKLAVKGDPAQVVGQLLSEKQVRDSAIRVGGAGVKPGTIKPSVSENDFIKVRSLNPMGEPLIEACPTRGSGGQPAMHPTGR
jgi:hypothetical protein